MHDQATLIRSSPPRSRRSRSRRARTASSHREAPAIALDPAADNTDVYAWVEPGTHDKLYIVANWIPLEEPAAAPTSISSTRTCATRSTSRAAAKSLDDAVDVLHRVQDPQPTRVAQDDIAFNEELFNGIQFFAQIAAPPPQQTYTVTKVENGRESTVLVDGRAGRSVNIGPRTDAVVYKPASGMYDDAFAATLHPATLQRRRARVRRSARRRLLRRPRRHLRPRQHHRGRDDPTDGVAGYNTHSIALEIPTAELTGTGKAPTTGPSDAQTLGVWAASSRRKVTIRRREEPLNFGPWVQVSRLGLPLVNEALIGLQDKDKYNRTHPRDDLAELRAVLPAPGHRAQRRRRSASTTSSASTTPRSSALKHGPTVRAASTSSTRST